MNWISRIVGIFFFLVLLVLAKTFLHKTISSNEKTENLPVYSTVKIEHDEIDNMDRDFADTGRCSYSTTSSVNADSIDMTFYFPCSWREYDENRNIPTLIRQYSINISDSCAIALSVDISTSPVNLTEQIIKKIRTTEFLKDLTKASGDFVSFQKIELGAILGDEVMTKKITHNPESSTFSLLNHFYFNNRVITFTYLVVSKNYEYAFAVFDRYKDLFRSLVKRTKISKQ